MHSPAKTVAWQAGLFACLAGGCGSSPSPGRPLVIAHRGDSRQAPENTLAAFRAALAAGADMVELDARASADGTLWCLHDATLDRTSNVRALLDRAAVRIGETSSRQIEILDAGSWFDPDFAGQRVPTLSSALDLIQSGSVALIERKSGDAGAYVRLLREKDLVSKVVVQSFDWAFLEQMHALEPSQPLAALGDKEPCLERLEALETTGARMVAWEYQQLTPEIIARLHQRGYAVWAWTPDREGDWQRLIAWGIDGIITNRPGALSAMLQRRAVPQPAA